MIYFDPFPKNCGECPCFSERTSVCKAHKAEGQYMPVYWIYTVKKRPEWCEMKELIHCGDCKYFVPEKRFCKRFENATTQEHSCSAGRKKK